MPETKFDAGAIKFDMSRVRARDVQTMMKSAQANDLEPVAELLARVIVAGPWDVLDSPDTYLDLPLNIWRAVIQAFARRCREKTK